MGVGGQRHAPAALPLKKRPGTHCTGGWIGPKPGLDACGKSLLYRDSIPGRSQPEVDCSLNTLVARVMAQAVIVRPVSAEAMVQSQASPCGIYGG
jgi:hypothetical protein